MALLTVDLTFDQANNKKQNFVLNIGDSEFGNLVAWWHEQDIRVLPKNKRTNSSYYCELWWLVFVRFLEEIKDTKNHFEIILPLIRNKQTHFHEKDS